MNSNKNWHKKKEKTNFWGMDIIVFSFKIGGWYLANFILFFVTCFVWLFNPTIKNYSKEYFEHLNRYLKLNNYPPVKGSTFIHIFRFSQTILEKILAWKEIISIDYVDSVENAHNRMLEVAKKNEGAIVIGSHIGNIEMLRAINQTVSQKTINILILTSNSQKFLKYLNNINNKSNLNFIVVEDIHPGIITQLDEKVSAGEWVVVLADRLNNEKTRFSQVEFLSGKIKLPQGPWYLSHLLHVPVYSLFNVKINKRNTLFFNEWGIIQLSRKDKEKDIQVYAQKFACEMERVLIKAPYDWFNFYSYWHEDN